MSSAEAGDLAVEPQFCSSDEEVDLSVESLSIEATSSDDTGSESGSKQAILDEVSVFFLHQRSLLILDCCYSLISFPTTGCSMGILKNDSSVIMCWAVCGFYWSLTEETLKWPPDTSLCLTLLLLCFCEIITQQHCI